MITVKVSKKEIKDIELSMPFIVCQINRKTREISLLSPADVEVFEKQEKEMIQRFRDKINAKKGSKAK